MLKTRELVNGRIPVILNIAEQSTPCALDQVKKVENYGVDGLMLLPPMHYKADARKTVVYF